MPNALLRSECPDLTLLARGKVRDVYALDDQHLLFVASDRISAFDVIMANGIPGKGRMLTQLSVFWFDLLAPLGPNHFITNDIAKMPASVQKYRNQLEGRTMLVRRLRILPVEAIVRGYLTGSGMKEYKVSGTVCGLPLPKGLVEASKLEAPLYTPSTKAEIGAHDENIHPDKAASLIGKDFAVAVQNRAIQLYSKARDYAATRGIIIADTKFEFGTDGVNCILADEVLTPDSSRFWPAKEYQEGKVQNSFDKQYLRNWLEKTGFNKNGPGVELPNDVVEATAAKYKEAFVLLTGKDPVL